MPDDVALARQHEFEAYCLDCGGVETRTRLWIRRVTDAHIHYEFACVMRRYRRWGDRHSCELLLDRQELRQGRLVIGVRCLQCDENALDKIRTPIQVKVHGAFKCSEPSHRWCVLINGRVEV